MRSEIGFLHKIKIKEIVLVTLSAFSLLATLDANAAATCNGNVVNPDVNNAIFIQGCLGPITVSGPSSVSYISIENSALRQFNSIIGINITDSQILNLTNSSSGSLIEIGVMDTISNVRSAIASLSNNNTISSQNGAAIYNGPSSTIGNLLNNSAATITATASGNALLNSTSGSIGTLDNRGTISSSNNTAIINDGNIGNLYNRITGNIVNNSSSGAIRNSASGLITQLYNEGTISSSGQAPIMNFGRIDEITNTGTITRLNSPFAAIDVRGSGFITTLNNAQGGSSPLTYSGLLPTNYNVILSSNSYGKLVASYASGTTAFGIAPSSTVNNNYTYSGVLSGVIASQVTNRSGTFGSYNWNLMLASGSTDVWDLIFGPLGPSAIDTQASMTPNAYALRGAYSLQSAIINTGLTYDCTTFDKNGICVSAGGRVTDANNPSTNSQGALLIASYRANDQWRVGAYLDQNLSSNDARGVNLDNSNPMGGLFAVWNQNTDGTGYQVRLAAGYSDKDVTISRSAFGATGEAGKGDSSLQSQAYSATVSRGFNLNNTRWIASPYLSVRYTKIKRAGYTEDTSADVTAPLTYSALSQETTTALAGVRFNGQLGDKINLMASAGIENDIAHNTGDYTATGVDGLTPIAFNQNIRHIRPVASAGVSYAIDKRQTVGANVNFRQEAFNSTNSVSGMVTYQVGF